MHAALQSSYINQAKATFDSAQAAQLPAQTRDRLLRGKLIEDGELEPFLPKERVRLFLSSTFDDTRFEQDAILSTAYPFLKQFCRELGLDFDIVSMRWGVNGRSMDEHLTAELCLQQLDMCLQESAGLAFITLQSHRYGYRPFPNCILQSEFDRLVASLRREKPAVDVYLLEAPYWLVDVAADPPVVQLQPISSLPNCEDFLLSEGDRERGMWDKAFQSQREALRKAASAQWWRIFETMQGLLRRGAALCNLTDIDAQKYSISVTHSEVVRGVLNNTRAAEQALCFIRTISTDDDDDAAAATDVDEKTRAAYFEPGDAALLQDALKNELRLCLPADRLILTDLAWVAGGKLSKDQSVAPEEGGWKRYIDVFPGLLIDKVCTTLLSSYQKPMQDSLVTEVLLQRSLVHQKLKDNGFGREAVLQALSHYLSPSQDEGENRRTFVLHGGSGCGKSWVLCKATHCAASSLPPDGIVVSRLVGTSKSTTDAFSLLQGVAMQLCHLLDGDPAKIPATWTAMSIFFGQGACFAGATAARPVTLLLDSIDQLAATHRALDDLSWIPGLRQPLPPHVRVVISTLPEEKGRFLLRAMHAFPRGVEFCELPPLGLFGEAEGGGGGGGRDVVEALMESRPAVGHMVSVRRILLPSSKQLVMKLCQDQGPALSPLFLKLLLDIVCAWPSYASPEQSLTLASAAGVRGLINLILSSLEERHGKLLVHTALGLLTAARDGLSETELEDALSCDDAVLEAVFEWWVPPVRRLPPMLVQRIVSGLGGYLVKRGSGGVTVLQWHHRQWWEAARERYLRVGNDAHRAAVCLAKLFSGQSPRDRLIDPHCLRMQPLSSPSNSTSPRPENLLSGPVDARRCSELPRALLLQGPAGIYDCSALLCDLPFVVAKVDAGLLGELVDDYLAVLEEISKRKGDLHVHAELKAYWRFVLENKHRWQGGRVSVLQSALYLPEASCIFRSAVLLCEGIVSSHQAALEVTSEEVDDDDPKSPRRAGGGVADYLDAGDLAVVNRLVKWTVGRPLYASPCVGTFEGHSRQVSCIALHPTDGLQLASAGRDNRVKMWELGSGLEAATLEGHTPVPACRNMWQGGFCAWSRDGQLLATASEDRVCCVWSSKRELLFCLDGHHEDIIEGVAFSGCGGLLASACWDGKVGVWSLEARALVCMLCGQEGPQGRVVCVAWEWATTQEKNDPGRLASAGGNVLNGQGAVIRIWQKRAAEAVAVAVAGDGEGAGDGDDEGRVGFVCTAVLEGHSADVQCLAWHPAGGRLASGAWDNTVRIFDIPVSGLCAQIAVIPHSNWMFSVAWSKCGSRLATGSGDKLARVFEIALPSPALPSPALPSPGDTPAPASVGFKLVCSLGGHSGTVRCVIFSAKDDLLITSSDDSRIKIWSLQAAVEQLAADANAAHRFWTQSVAWNPVYSELLASGGDDSSVRIFTVPGPGAGAERGVQARPLVIDLGTNVVRAVAWSPCGTFLAVAASRLCKIYRYVAGLPVLMDRLRGHTDDLQCIAWHPLAGSRLIATSAGKFSPVAMIWKKGGQEAGEGFTCVRVLRGHTDRITGLCYSPCGNLLVTSSWDCSVRLWDLLGSEGPSTTTRADDLQQAGEQDAESVPAELAALPHSTQVDCVALSSCGSILATGDRNKSGEKNSGDSRRNSRGGGVVRLYALWVIRGDKAASAGGDCVCALPHVNRIASLAFSPGGVLPLLAVCSGWVVKLWKRDGGGEASGKEGQNLQSWSCVRSVCFDESNMQTCAWQLNVAGWNIACGDEGGRVYSFRTAFEEAEEGGGGEMEDKVVSQEPRTAIGRAEQGQAEGKVSAFDGQAELGPAETFPSASSSMTLAEKRTRSEEIILSRIAKPDSQNRPMPALLSSEVFATNCSQVFYMKICIDASDGNQEENEVLVANVNLGAAFRMRLGCKLIYFRNNNSALLGAPTREEVSDGDAKSKQVCEKGVIRFSIGRGMWIDLFE